VSRLRTEKISARFFFGDWERVEKAMQEFDSGLADDLNTAQALAAIFDLVREVNIAMDRGEFRQGDVAPVFGAMEKFDVIFAVLRDDDAEKLRSLGIGKDSAEPSDAEVEALVAERQACAETARFCRLRTGCATSLRGAGFFLRIRATARYGGSESRIGFRVCVAIQFSP